LPTPDALDVSPIRRQACSAAWHAAIKAALAALRVGDVRKGRQGLCSADRERRHLKSHGLLNASFERPAAAIAAAYRDGAPQIIDGIYTLIKAESLREARRQIRNVQRDAAFLRQPAPHELAFMRQLADAVELQQRMRALRACAYDGDARGSQRALRKLQRTVARTRQPEPSHLVFLRQLTEAVQQREGIRRLRASAERGDMHSFTEIQERLRRTSERTHLPLPDVSTLLARCTERQQDAELAADAPRRRGSATSWRHWRAKLPSGGELMSSLTRPPFARCAR
jgi:hypothetical protein